MVPPTPLSTRRHRSRRASGGNTARVATCTGFSLLAALIAVTATVSSFEIATLDGHGYWLIASDGGVFAYGDAPFYGSAGGDNLAYPVTTAAPSFLGGGYWMADANGQVLPYGNAVFEGQPAFAPGGYRITGMTGTRSSNGYWLASANGNGNVADFGDAAPYGSMIGRLLNAPVVGIAPTGDGAGYWPQGSDGGIFTFGDAPFLGSMGGQPLNAPMVGIAST